MTDYDSLRLIMTSYCRICLTTDYDWLGQPSFPNASQEYLLGI